MVLAKVKNKYLLIIIIGTFFIILSSTVFIYNSIKQQIIIRNEQIRIDEFLNIDNYQNVDTSIHQLNNSNNKNSNQITYNYIAILEIPSINLRKGLIEQNSKYNNVKYNVEIITSSTLPDTENGNLILASHNGASYISYFKNLSKMNIGDKIYIYYNSYRYEYILSKTYDVKKTGEIEIHRDYNKTTITLITCKKNTNDEQVVYIGYLNNKTIY